MKRNFTLVLAVFLFITQSLYAKGIDSKFTSSYSRETSSTFTVDSLPYKIYFSLYSEPVGDDTAYLNTNAGCAVVFDSAFSSQINGPEESLDFNFMFTSTEDISFNQFGQNFSVIGWNVPTNKDTVNLEFIRPSAPKYQLLVNPIGFDSDGVIPYLYDNYLNKSTILDSTFIFYNFTSNADSIATYQNRFSVIFKSGTLPVRSIALNAILKDGNAVLTWTTTGQNNVESFSIEKSVNGTTYTTLSNVAAKNTTNVIYSYTDANVANGNTYYRIKAISKTGEATYSQVSVINKVTVSGYGIYPNPARNSTVNLKLTNAISGSYIVNIYNLAGKKVATKQIQHSGGTATYGLTLDNNLATGLYKVNVLSANNSKAVYETSLLIQK